MHKALPEYIKSLLDFQTASLHRILTQEIIIRVISQLCDL